MTHRPLTRPAVQAVLSTARGEASCFIRLNCYEFRLFFFRFLAQEFVIVGLFHFADLLGQFFVLFDRCGNL